MKKLLTWCAVGLLSSAFLDPIIYSMLEMPIPWGRDALMAIAGAGCYYLLIRFRTDW